MPRRIQYKILVLKESRRSSSAISIFNEEACKEEKIKEWTMNKERQALKKCLNDIEIAKQQQEEIDNQKKQRRKRIKEQIKIRKQNEQELLKHARQKLSKIKKLSN